MMNGPGGRINRGHRIEHLGSDAWKGGGLVVNGTCIDINRGPTAAHPDFYQSQGKADNPWSVILYNVSGYDCQCQGLFGSYLKDSAFVNVLFDRPPGTSYASQVGTTLDNVLYLHVGVYGQSFWVRGEHNPAFAHDGSHVNGIYQNMSQPDGGDISLLYVDHNHFIGGTPRGNHSTTGDAVFVDAEGNNFHLQPTSPAWGTALPLQCVPADLNGAPRHPTAPNRGPLARGDVAMLEVTAWQTAAVHGGAGTLLRTVIDGDVHASLAPLSELRVAFNQPLDPATLGATPVAITAQTAGDLTSTVQSATLADADRTLVIALSQPLPQGDRVTVAIDPALRSTLNLEVTGDGTLELGILTGDADGSGTVGEGDIVAVREASGNADPQSVARYDIDASGSVSGADQAAARARIGNALP